MPPAWNNLIFSDGFPGVGTASVSLSVDDKPTHQQYSTYNIMLSKLNLRLFLNEDSVRELELQRNCN